jgi:branched-chain amino acid transport system ATP-binding protein
MEALRVEKLSKSFGRLQALQDVSLTVESGERRAIIGPNGAGKTTLFNLVVGELHVSSGGVYLFDQDITAMPQHHRVHLGLARTYQINSLFLRLSILDNIVLAIQSYQHLRYQMFRSAAAYNNVFDRAKEVLERIGLWQKRDVLVQDIAYGEQRQIEIILAMASEPKVLLMDEPTAGLSEAETEVVINMIRGLGNDITVIIVSHDMDVIFQVADKISVFNFGQLITSGNPEEVRADPKVQNIYLGSKV